MTALEKEKRPKNNPYRPILNWTVFIGGFCIAAMSAAIDITGGFFPDKLIGLAARMVIIGFFFYWIAFRMRVREGSQQRFIWWQEGLATIFSLYQTYQITKEIFTVYLLPIRQGGAPIRAQRIFDAIPFGPEFKYVFLVVLVAIAGLLACYAIERVSVSVIRLLQLTVRTTIQQLDYPEATNLLPLNRRIIIGVGAAVFTAILCFFTLHKGQEWGADYAVYLSQAISFATGKLENINVVWGFGAMLVPIYWLVGYDRVDFSSIIYYKIPGVICLSLLVFVLFLFFSKRFNVVLAVTLTAIFGLNPIFIGYTNEILTNIPHMLFSMLCIMSFTAMFEEKTLGRQVVYAIITGILIGICDLIRVNGIVLVLTLACVHLFLLISWLLRKYTYFKGLNSRMPISRPWVHVIPYITYFVFVKAANWLIFAGTDGAGVTWGGLTAGAQTLTTIIEGGGLHQVTFIMFLNAVKYYWNILMTFLAGITPFNTFRGGILFLLVPLVIIGLIRSFRKELISVVYFFGMMMMLCVIVYRQGIRYVFPVLPMLILFLAVGVQSFTSAMYQQDQDPKRLKRLLRVGLAMICASFLLSASYTAYLNMQAQREYDLYSYSEDAKDIYRYLQDNTQLDATVVFVKPMVVILNAERKSKVDIPNRITGDTYFLYTNQGPGEHQLIDPEDYGSIEGIEQKRQVNLELIYSNPRFELYQVFPIGAALSTK